MRGLLDCFGEAFDDPESYCSAQPDNAYLEELLAGRQFFAIVAVIAGDIVGGLAGYELPKFEQQRSELYIYDLAVREPFRRRGIATALIQRAR
ncbi:GNAT family N-acetyltransferase, partial [bacterium]|nr:GNAT family N-acetyltransferase [bacterium]